MNRCDANTGYPQLIWSYLYTCAFCLLVAFVVWLVGMSPSLSSSLIVSFSIGLSINSAFLLLTPSVERFLPPAVTVVCIIALGAVIGLILAGWFVADHGLFFFSEDFTALILMTVLAVAGSVYVINQLKLQGAKIKLAEQEKSQLQTELRLLQAQIEPHFLFNTLANISSLISSDAKNAQTMLDDLTAFLRASLQRTREGDTTLENELELIRRYLAIQQIRLGERLRYSIDVEPALISQPFPPLLLQPLVENAVVHGIEPSEMAGELLVKIGALDDAIDIRIIDTGVGLTDQSQAVNAGLKIGIRNVKNRIALLYGEKASLQLIENKPSGLIVQLQIPHRTDAQRSTAE